MLMLALVPAAVLAQEAPDAMIKRIADEVLTIIRSDKDLAAGNQQKVAALAEQKVLPHFDFTRMAVAVPEGFDYESAVKQGARLRVATKYINTAREHFAAKGVHVDLIKLYGSMELAPLVGLADAIVDLVDTGNTLRANRLKVVEEMMSISSRLIVNPASLKLKRDAIAPLIEAFRKAAHG